MSVRAPKVPSQRAVIGALDAHARRTVELGRREVGPVVSRETPKKTSATAQALRPRVSRTADGAALIVAVPRGKRHPSSGKVTISQVIRFVGRGTGVHRNTPGVKQPIRSKRRPPQRLVLPGGRKVWSVEGQKPNPFLERIEAAATIRVTRVFTVGAVGAGRVIERLMR